MNMVMWIQCIECERWNQIEEDMIPEYGNFGFDCDYCKAENDTACTDGYIITKKGDYPS